MDLKPKPLPESRVKQAWQNEAGLYAVKTMFSDEEPIMLSGDELEKLTELMPDYSWMIVENPIYEDADFYNELKQSNPNLFLP